MSNAILSWVNHCDLNATVINTSSEVMAMPATSLKDSKLRNAWRTGFGVTTAALSFDFQVKKQVGVVGLFQPNNAGGFNADNEPKGWMKDGDSVRHWLDNTFAGGGELFDSGQIAGDWVPGYGMHILALETPIEAKIWTTALIANSLIADPKFIDIGRVWAGPAFSPSINFAFDWARSWQDGGEIRRNPTSGLEFPRRGPRFRAMNFAFQVLSEEDADMMDELQRVAGTTQQVLFVPFPGTPGQNKSAVLGRLQSISPISAPGFDRFSSVFQIVQSI